MPFIVGNGEFFLDLFLAISQSSSLLEPLILDNLILFFSNRFDSEYALNAGDVRYRETVVAFGA